MKQMLQATLLTGLLLISVNTFAQTATSGSEETGDSKKAGNTYFDILFNAVSTNLNYGDPNGAFSRL